LKVVHFSTTHEGGAGLAARRLSQALNMHGIDSVFYSLRQSSYLPQINEHEINRNWLRRIQSFACMKIQNLLTRKTLFSTYSSNAASLKYFSSFGQPREVILHFHNWANLISQRNLQNLVKLGFRIVITLHDQRLLTGGCHYTLDCSQIEIGCARCPRASRGLSRKIRQVKSQGDFFLSLGNRNLKLIAPSLWMSQSTPSLSRFGIANIVHIPNVLGPFWNNEQYSYSPRGRSAGIITVGVASNTQNSYVKASELVEQLRKESQDASKNYRIIFLSDPQYRSAHSNFWKEIDYLLALSRADNSPNVIAEAKSLGISVIASAVGGIPELLNDNSDHLIFEKDLNFAFLDAFLNRLKRVRVEEPVGEARRRSDFKDMASVSNLISLYESLVTQE